MNQQHPPPLLLQFSLIATVFLDLGGFGVLNDNFGCRESFPPAAAGGQTFSLMAARPLWTSCSLEASSSPAGVKEYLP